MSLERFANAPFPSLPGNSWTTLSADIDASTTTITPLSITTFPVAVQFRIQIEDELLIVTGESSGVWTVTRGAEGTTAAAHSAGSSIFHILTAASLLRNPRSMTTLGDIEYLDATGSPTRLGAPADGVWAVQFSSGIPSWSTISVPTLLSQLTNDVGYLVASDLSSYVTLTGVQTLTNKTLTSPTLTGPVTVNGAVGSSAVTIAGGTQTASNPALSITQTWNAPGVTMVGKTTDITDTASASASLIEDWKVGGTSKVAIRKDGYVMLSGNAALGRSAVLGGTAIDIAGANFVWLNTAGVVIGTSGDMFLARDAADVLAQYRSTNPQAYRLYNTRTDASNGEWATVNWASNILHIGATKNGTGTARAMQLDYGGTTTAAISIPATSGNVTFGGGILLNGLGTLSYGGGYFAFGNNISSLAWVSLPGGLGDSRNGFVIPYGGTYRFSSATTSQYSVDSAISRSGPASLQINNGTPGTYGDLTLRNLKVGGTTSSFPAVAQSPVFSTHLAVRLADDSAFGELDASGLGLMSGSSRVGMFQYSTGFGLASGLALWWTDSATDANSNRDLYIQRDAADTLAQYRGTNAQTFRLYNTRTDASNYELFEMNWAAISNTLLIRTKASGTGTRRSISFGYSDASTDALVIPSGQGSAVLVGVGTRSSFSDARLRVGVQSNTTLSSGTAYDFFVDGGAAPSSTSTMAYYPVYIKPTINYSAGTPGSGSYEALKIAVTETALPTGTNYLIRASAGASGTTDKFYVLNSGTVVSTASGSLGSFITIVSGQPTVGISRNGTVGGLNLWGSGPSGANISSDNGDFCVNGSGVVLPSNRYVGWASGSVTQPVDLALWRDAAATLALRNSTNAQAFRVYNTYTDASNGEWFTQNWASNVYHFGATKNGTGTARSAQWDFGGTNTAAISVPGTSGPIALKATAVNSPHADSAVDLTVGDLFEMSAWLGAAYFQAYKRETSSYVAAYWDADSHAFRIGTTAYLTLAYGGSKFGTTSSQPLGFWGATPVVQQVLATGAAHTVDDVIGLLQTLGLCRQS